MDKFLTKYEFEELNSEYISNILLNFDSMSSKSKIEFFDKITRHLLTINISTSEKLELFKKIIYNEGLLDSEDVVCIFELIINFKNSDIQTEICKLISLDDEDKIIKMLSNKKYNDLYTKSIPALEKFIMFSIFGSKVSDYIESFIVNNLKNQNFSTSWKYWQNISLKFTLLSPYVNYRNIFVHLYKLDKEFCMRKFIPQVPECEKYKVLL